MTRHQMVRVLRQRVRAYDGWTEEQIREAIQAIAAEIQDLPENAQEDEFLRRTNTLCRAITPDFATKIHHASNCWYVDEYKQGRWGRPRRFVLIRASDVPPWAEGCQFCESGRAGANTAGKISLGSVQSESGPRQSHTAAQDDDVIKINSQVQVRDLDSGEERSWRLIDDLAHRAPGTLSSSSAVGRALMGKRSGDIAIAVTPRGQRRLKVLETLDGPDDK